MAETGMRAAEKPAAEKETKDAELQAIKDAVGAISKRVDALFGKGEEGEKKDAAEGDEGDDDAKKDAGDEEKGRLEEKDAKKDDDGFGGKKAPPFGEKKDAKKDGELEDWAKEEEKEEEHKGKPEDLASDAKRKDAEEEERQDRSDRTAMGREIKELRALLDERTRPRHRSDDELNLLAEKQQEWEVVAMAHGKRAPRPLEGEGLASYDRRCAKAYQEHSDKWGKTDLAKLPPDVLTVITPEIRADAIAAAYRGDAKTTPRLREVQKRDRTGRVISEFVGPVGETLAPFIMPPLRVRRINPQPNQY